MNSEIETLHIQPKSALVRQPQNGEYWGPLKVRLLPPGASGEDNRLFLERARRGRERQSQMAKQRKWQEKWGKTRQLKVKKAAKDGYCSRCGNEKARPEGRWCEACVLKEAGYRRQRQAKARQRRKEAVS